MEKAVSIGNGQTNNISMTAIANSLDTMHDQQAILLRGGQSEDMSYLRRLLPLEAERLQGFPDEWTQIGEPDGFEIEVDPFDGSEYRYQKYKWYDKNGKKHKCTDADRYKAIGNSIALPFWFYLLRRIAAQYERPATLGSLFSGIGGFELCWVKCNGTGTVLWSSEIEEFPIEVLRKHFGDEDSQGDVGEYL